MLWLFEPASGSVIANTIFVPVTIGRSQRSRCSAVPKCLMSSAQIAGETRISRSGQPTAASSSHTIASSDMPAPPPPYSSGRCTPRKPSSAIASHSSWVRPSVRACVGEVVVTELLGDVAHGGPQHLLLGALGEVHRTGTVPCRRWQWIWTRSPPISVPRPTRCSRALEPLDGAGWATPTPAPGWRIQEQIAHLAYFDEQAALAARDADAFQRELEAALADPDGITERISDAVARACSRPRCSTGSSAHAPRWCPRSSRSTRRRACPGTAHR